MLTYQKFISVELDEQLQYGMINMYGMVFASQLPSDPNWIKLCSEPRGPKVEAKHNLRKMKMWRFKTFSKVILRLHLLRKTWFVAFLQWSGKKYEKDPIIKDKSQSCKMSQNLWHRYGRYICLSAQSIVHGDVLSEKINFSAHGSSNSANFGPDYLDP